jgi:anti-sigma factor RsiW
MNDRLAPDLEELHAYVDGQLGSEARQRVETRLTAEPQTRRQVDDYAAIREGIKALYGPVADEVPPPRLLRRPRSRQWYRIPLAMAASLLLFVAGGYVGVQIERGHLSPAAGAHSLVREAAMAYAVYTPEVRHPVEVPGDQEQHLVTWLTKRMGAQVHVPSLDALGFTLLGGRLLASDDGPGALLMYEDAQGRRLVLYACRNEDGDRETAFRFGRAEGVSVFYWQEGTLSYALAGEMERSDLLSVAEAVYRQIAI